ncbi:hypothetical protein BZL43_06785 [Pseudomonas sp. PICF141]|nr:hypothetical protein BZL43_06785 [Pseudomonas sp. PICF141]
MARGLAPVRLRSSRRFWGRFATQRGQAPSPQVHHVPGPNSMFCGQKPFNSRTTSLNPGRASTSSWQQRCCKSSNATR